MLHYQDGNEVCVGDRLVFHMTSRAVVEILIEGEEVGNWNLDEPGFMIMTDDGIRVYVEEGGYDWEDVVFEGRSL